MSRVSTPLLTSELRAPSPVLPPHAAHTVLPSQLAHTALLAPASPLVDEAMAAHDIAAVCKRAARHLGTDGQLKLRPVKRTVAAAVVIGSKPLEPPLCTQPTHERLQAAAAEDVHLGTAEGIVAEKHVSRHLAAIRGVLPNGVGGVGQQW